MRVLLISHTCQSRAAGQMKADLVAAHPDIELTVVVPSRWKDYGRWRGADEPDPASRATYRILEPSLPWTGPGQTYLHGYAGLAGVIREFQPQVIDIWEEPWSRVSVQACRLRRRFAPRARILAETEQNIDKKLPPPFEWFRTWTLLEADFLVGRSLEAVRVAERKGFRGATAVVPNGVDSGLFRPLDRAECRARIAQSGFLAGYVGRLVEEKGLREMVEMLPHCDASVRAIFVGEGPFEAELRTLAAQRGLSDRVTFLPAVPPKELAGIMNALDVLVLPSRTTARWKEQFGRVLIEAMACELPVIGSDSGAIPDVIGKAGLVFPEGDPVRLGASVEVLRNDPDQRKLLGRKGRQSVEGWCSWEKVAEQMVGIYRRLVP